MDEGMLDGVAAMTKFVNLIASEPDISKVNFANKLQYFSFFKAFRLLGVPKDKYAVIKASHDLPSDLECGSGGYRWEHPII